MEVVFLVNLINLRQLVIYDTKPCINLMITRYMKNEINGVIHFPAFAPSAELLKFWKASDKSDESWEIYCEEYKRQMSLPEAEAAFRTIELLSEKCERINMICYCEDANKCHRSILGQLLEEHNIQVHVV